MKRVLSFSLILIVFCITGLLGGSFFMSSLAYAQDTEENVVEIGTAGDLKNYIESYGQDNVQDNIVLTADINISSLADAEDETADVVFGSIGTEENPFAGTFDGRGYSITNLQIDTRTTEEQTLQSNQYAGLFGYTDGAKIQNVDLSGNVTLSVGGCVSSYVGALVGRAVDTDIQFCQVTARVNLDATFDHNINFGVLAGMVVDSDISYVICRYTATSGLGTWNFDLRTDNIFNFGGVVGVLSNSTLDFAVVSERFFVNVSEDFVGDVSLGGIVGNVVQGGSQIFNVATENSFSITNNALTSVEAIVSVGEVAGVVSNPVPTSGNIAYIHFQNNIGIERFGRMGEYSYANSALYDNMTVANERITSEDYFNNQMWHWQYGSWDFKTTWYFGSGTVNLQSFYGNFNISLSNSLDNSVLTSETQLQSVYRFGDSVDIEFSFQPLVRDEMTVGDMSKYYSLGSVVLSNAQLSSQEIASIVALPGSNGEILTYRISAKNDTNGDFSYFNNLLSITKNEDDKALTQLEAIVNYTRDYCERENIKRLPGICQPPLKDILYMKEIKKADKNKEQGILVNVGIYDDPGQQLQEELTINLSENNVYIAGASQMGKTTMLQTILYNIMDRYSPDEVNVYIIDCGNMALKVFEESGHVGGVVLGQEEEKLVNLFKMLQTIIEDRKEIFSKKGLGTFSSYVEAGFKDVPQIIVVLDNVAVFREQFADCFDTLLSLSRVGISVGINFIVTGTQANSFGFKALANYGTRLALFCTEKAEYANIFGRCRIEPKETPGRGLCVIDKQVKEFQTALAFEGTKEIERVENMKKFIASNSAKYNGKRARVIPVVPKIIHENVTLNNNRELYSDPSRMPYAIDYTNVDFKFIDFMNDNYMVITGGEGKGKTNLTKLILNHFERNIFEYPSNIYIMDNDNNELEGYENNATVKGYTTKPEDIKLYMEKMEEELIKRQEEISIAGKNNFDYTSIPYLILVINDKNVMAEIAKKKELQPVLARLVKEYKKLKSMVIFADFDNAQIPFNAYDALKYIKGQKKYYVFEDMANIKIADITPKLARAYSKNLIPGDAYVFDGNEIVKIKTIYAG